MNKAGQLGFGLLEAVTAITILAAGMMALWSALNRSQQQAHQLQNSVLATALMRDLAARLHMHRDAFGGDTSALYVHPLGQALPSPQPCTQACSASAWARHNLADWGQALVTQLPQAQFAIEASARSPGFLLVLLAWPDPSISAPRPAETGLGSLACPARHQCRWVHIRP